ncbi:MAG: FHA domain-containing protein [Planctomycetes bacterium]|nr:FHA domain-containing protein [Planctomycetota bacterium]
MGSAEVAMEWQTLADLAKGAALPVETFRATYGGPFLLELNPESGLATGETRAFDPEKLRSDMSPSLKESLILSFAQGVTSLTLGRGEGAQLRVAHASVSDRHCVFERVGPLWSIRDAGSKNGTFLNGRQLGVEEQAPLKFGTKLNLGEAQFLFLSPDDCYELLQELCKEPRIRPRSMGKFKADFKAAGTAEKILEAFPGPFLVVQAPTSGGDAGGPVSTNTVTLSREELSKKNDRNVADAVFDLSRHTLVRIGRATVTQIHIPLGAISNLHAALVREGDKWFVQDLGAKNGTYIWGDRLDGRRELESGSEIHLGNIKSIFFNTEDFVTYAGNRDIV